MPRKQIVRSLLLATALVSGCEPGIPRVDPSQRPFKGMAAAELEHLRRGRAAYAAKCSGCHVLYPPLRGDASYWKRWIRKMEPMVSLAPGEEAPITDYLLATCATAATD